MYDTPNFDSYFDPPEEEELICAECGINELDLEEGLVIDQDEYPLTGEPMGPPICTTCRRA